MSPTCGFAELPLATGLQFLHDEASRKGPSRFPHSLFRDGIHYSSCGLAGVLSRQAGGLLAAYQVALFGGAVVWRRRWILAGDRHGDRRFQE